MTGDTNNNGIFTDGVVEVKVNQSVLDFAKCIQTGWYIGGTNKDTMKSM
jgi:hypothetical protein